jgi:hypothetical protein
MDTSETHNKDELQFIPKSEIHIPKSQQFNIKKRLDVIIQWLFKQKQ